MWLNFTVNDDDDDDNDDDDDDDGSDSYDDNFTCKKHCFSSLPFNVSGINSRCPFFLGLHSVS